MKNSFFPCTLLALSLTALTMAVSPLPAQAANGDVALTATNFPDSKLREALSYYCDDDYDDVLSSEEIRSITTLDLYGCDISDLTGIEYLTSLEYLDCGGNKLTTLHLQNLPSLISLSCTDNSMTSFSVSNCPRLEDIDCSFNRITELLLANNTTVKTLELYDNRLTALDLSGCTSLIDFNITENPIVDLNLSGCTSLPEVYFYNDTTVSVNLDGCSSLIEISGTSDYITSLSLSGCSSLKRLYCDGDLTTLDFDDCIALEELDVTDSSLSSLDLSRCPKLKKVHCGYNRLSSLNLSGCAALTDLDCMNNKLTELNLDDCKSLKYLECSNNQLTSLNLKSCKSLKSTWIDGCSRKVPVTSKKLFDLTSLKGFNIKNAEFWYGADVTGDFITFTDEEAYYSYDTKGIDTDGDPIIAYFTLIPVVDSDLKLEIPLAKPVLKSISNVNGGVKLSWEPTKNASKYRVYRKIGDESWKKVKDVTSTSYTDKTTESGKTYTYTVRAYNGEFKSSYDTTGKKIKYLAIPSLNSVSNVSGGVKFSWKKVSSASKYRVYRKTEDSKWEKLEDISSTSYTDKSTKSGKKYTYTVRALNGSYSSSYNTTGKKIKYLSVPTLNKLKKTDTGIQISWKKVTGASKYVVYKKNSDGEWKKLKTITSLKYTDTSVKKGKTYTYTVRAYSGDYKSSYNSKGVKLKY